MTAASARRPIAISMGDPAGIGPEIVAKAFRDDAAATRGCFVAGDLAVMRRAARVVQHGGIDLPVALIDSPLAALHVPPRCIPLLQATAAMEPPRWGEISEQAGRAAADCVIWSARAALRGDLAAMVTAPLHKQALAAAGVAFPGHTEMLQAEAAAHAGCAIGAMPVRMMLANDELRTVLVSIHVSLRDAIAAVTRENVIETVRITHRALQLALGRPPRIAVAGLNPHAGEGGLMGRDELDVIAPAVEAAKAEGMDAHGPFPPDTIFMRARSAPAHPGEFDVVVAMYHDQGLIPVKYLGVASGVNVTLGLPLVRTSPDHGTAFDIAGTGRADAASLVAAIAMARRLAGAAA
jgi:4-hydroxythreonine-4-phosphate dehydrogenase